MKKEFKLGEYTLNEIQETIYKRYIDREYKAKPETLFMGIVEEIGELAVAMLLNREDFCPTGQKLSTAYLNDNIGEEVGDIITYCLALCNKLGITPKFLWHD